MKLQAKNIKPLISSENALSKWIGYVGLAIGILLLLLSVQMFVNIQKLLKEEAPRKSGGFDFVSISKQITNENMGMDNRFSQNDLELLRKQPEIVGVAPLYSNQFRASATAGDVLPFSTDLFLESLNTAFLDTLPPDFNWKPGQTNVPIIFSSDFLEMYNVFAPAQGLPQVSAKTVSSVNIFLNCSGPRGSENFKASIIALSDRVNSILVPESFLKWGNVHLSGDTGSLISRVYIKTRDANNPELIRFLDAHSYHINKDKIRFGRIKGMLQNTIGAIAALGVLVILLALILFGFYLQLMIARSKENVKLLLLLGYSPKWIANSFSSTFLPVYLTIILACLVLASGFQIYFSRISFGESDAGIFLHWSTWLTAILMFIMTIFINRQMVNKEIKQLEKAS